MRDGLRRMIHEQEDVYYYITVMNENYAHPAMPEGAEEGILRGMYLLREGAGAANAPRVQLLGSGTILREVLAAADLLAEDFGVAADVWSVTSFNELRRDGLARPSARTCCTRKAERKRPYVERALAGHGRGRSSPRPITSAPTPTAFGRSSTRRYHVLGTDGFGRSDYRRNAALVLRGRSPLGRARRAAGARATKARSPAPRSARAIAKYGIDPNKPNPVTV